MHKAFSAVPLPDWQSRPDDEIARRAAAFRADMKRRRTVRDFDTRPVAAGVIADCIATAGSAPSGANHQPWHFVAISNPGIKAQIRAAAEEEERRFYGGGAGEEWLKALEPMGTDHLKPHLELAPWLIVVFAQRWGLGEHAERFKHYYVPESVGIASGFLLAALHTAGLATLTHTPNPMRFLGDICGRPEHEKPIMIVAVGHPAADATVPAKALVKKPLDEIATFMD